MSQDSNGTHPVYRAEQVRLLDALLIKLKGSSEASLMERAGASAFTRLRQHWPQAQSLAVFAGPGNNGGDAYVVATLALREGLNVVLYAVGEHSRLSPASQEMRQAYLNLNGIVETALPPNSTLKRYDVVVDGLLGTGLSRSVTGVFKQAIELINSTGIPVLALDVPSGLDADCGAVRGVAVKATRTISFVGRKRGLYTGRARDYCGLLDYDSLGAPPELYEQVVAEYQLLDECEQQRLLKPRAATTHKGQCGHVLIVGGSAGFVGAACLAGVAALRSGAGRVSLALPPGQAAGVVAVRPELMCHEVALVDELLNLAASADVIAVGPGMGQDAWARHLFAALLSLEKPLIVDADALNLLAQDARARNDWILTPHPGEAARLLGQTVADIEADRFSAVERLVARYQAVVVLKGAGTLVRALDSATVGLGYVCAAGNPGMATAGMGDVLTGVIAALVAQGLSLDAAARVGTYIHACAGDQAAGALARGMLASDLFPYLRAGVNPASDAGI